MGYYLSLKQREVKAYACIAQLRVLIEKIINTNIDKEYYFFFAYIEKHLDQKERELKKEQKEDKREKIGKYINYFLNIFLNYDFFEIITKSSSSYDIWDNFPLDWKITEKSFKKVIPRVFFNIYLRTVQSTISKEAKFDEALNSINEKLFPEFEPIVWSNITSFAILSYKPNNRVKSFILKKNLWVVI